MRRLRLSLALSAATAAASLGVAQASAELDLTCEELRLDNGLQVLLHEDHSLPIAHVELWYHVGSKDEPAGRTGFAHLFEHLMFQGSEHADDEYFAFLKPYGARINGTTSTERTSYYETVPSNLLERALWLEADRMGFLLPALDTEKLDNQRDVVRNERRQNYENAPYGEVRAELAQQLWPEGHPYHHLTIGSHEDLEAASLDDVRSFFETWYVPNNATLTVVGDFETEQVRRWVERYFGPIASGAEARPVTEAEAPPPPRTTVELRDDVQLERVYLAWRSPALFEPGDAELDVLSSVLSDGAASRLHKRLVNDEAIAKDVYAFQRSSGLGSTYHLVSTVAPGHSADEVLAALDEELARVSAEGPTEREVERARNNWERSFFQRLDGVGGKASLLQSYNHHRGDPGYLAADLERYRAVTADAVREVAGQVLDDEHRVTIIVRPREEASP